MKIWFSKSENNTQRISKLFKKTAKSFEKDLLQPDNGQKNHISMSFTNFRAGSKPKSHSFMTDKQQPGRSLVDIQQGFSGPQRRDSATGSKEHKVWLKIRSKVGLLKHKRMPKHFLNNFQRTLKKPRIRFFRPQNVLK